MKYPAIQQASATPAAPLFDGSQPCVGEDLRLFFPPRGESAKHAVRQAKAICDRCPFLAPCLRYATDNDMAGVWGHTTAAERRAIRRRSQSPSLFRVAS